MVIFLKAIHTNIQVDYMAKSFIYILKECQLSYKNNTFLKYE